MAFIIFSTDVDAFTDMQKCQIAVINYTIGFYKVDEMLKKSEIMGPLFFMFVSIKMIVMSAVFLAIMIGHTIDEFEECREVMTNSDVWLWAVVYKIMQKRYERKRQTWTVIKHLPEIKNFQKSTSQKKQEEKRRSCQPP